VLGLRPDGYHEIDSLLQSIDLADLLTLRPEGEGHTLTVEGFPVPLDNSNLCLRAAEVLERYLSRPIAVHVHLHKRIPVAGGLGGGSADAAGVLVALNDLLEAGLSESQLMQLGAQVGSDVPPMIVGGTVLVGGRGERCRRLEPIRPLEMVIAQPKVGLATAEVYHWWDEQGSTSSVSAEEAAHRLGRPDQALPTEAMRNDLEPPVLARVAEAANLKERMLRLGASHVMLCGSGSAVAGFFADQASARRAAQVLSEELPFAKHCRTSACGVEFEPETRAT